MTVIYHLNVRLVACEARVFINGFPVEHIDARAAPRESAPPINLCLTGAYNRLDAEIHFEHEASEQVAVEGEILRFEKGDVVGPGAGDPVLSWSLPRQLRDQPSPWVFSEQFSTVDAPSFEHRLRAASQLRDEEAIRDYAMYVRELIARGMVDEFVEQMRPKLDDFARAFDEPVTTFEADLREYFRTVLLPGASVLDFSRSEVVPRPYCEGRVWELRRGTDDALITVPVDGGVVYRLPLYVGSHDGELEIVR